MKSLHAALLCLALPLAAPAAQQAPAQPQKDPITAVFRTRQYGSAAVGDHHGRFSDNPRCLVSSLRKPVVPRRERWTTGVRIDPESLAKESPLGLISDTL